jgi:hypothetical protein
VPRYQQHQQQGDKGQAEQPPRRLFHFKRQQGTENPPQTAEQQKAQQQRGGIEDGPEQFGKDRRHQVGRGGNRSEMLTFY